MSSPLDLKLLEMFIDSAKDLKVFFWADDLAHALKNVKGFTPETFTIETHGYRRTFKWDETVFSNTENRFNCRMLWHVIFPFYFHYPHAWVNQDPIRALGIGPILMALDEERLYFLREADAIMVRTLLFEV